VLDAWYSLPNLPFHMSDWMRASSAKMAGLRIPAPSRDR
jgi:hypothetical protein